MRDADQILSIIHERGKQGLPLERVYRLLFNPALYLKAYGKIYRNDGALTAGTTEETADGMSMSKIEAIIEALRYERYKWTPVRRIYIEKRRSKKLRPLGLPAWSDKLLQEVMRLILSAYYEPQFSPTSYGFRPGRGCHTALNEIYHKWIGTKWLVEGDIAQCFDALDHTVMMAILGEKIHDGRLLRLIEMLLQAGYLEEWCYHATYSGSPQGGILSPLLANVYLDKLDKFAEHTLLPKYTRGTVRRENPPYTSLKLRASCRRRSGQTEEAERLRRQMQQIPALDPTDPSYRRIRYARYADDWLIGFSGPREEAEEIKQQIGEFLRETLKLQLSETKTLITHAQTEAAQFLGYQIVMCKNDQKHDWRGHRSLNGQIGLRAPMHVIQEKCQEYLQHGKPVSRKERTEDTVYSIISQYQQEYRGLAEYYQLAGNRYQLNRLKWVMERSLVATLAQKLRITVSQVYDRYQTTVETPHGPRKALQVTVEREGKQPLIARWGGISLARNMKAILEDSLPWTWGQRSELEKRLLANVCELCGSQMQVEVHHIRALKDLQPKGQRERPRWMYIMAARRRKTLIVCRKCHEDIHAGRANGQRIRT
ncbi:maturase [Ktedonobacter sp. SOSP1-85]|uniref:reverse transcriptase/maturase family protein n=1 Tax=Ktedonobacter sp. SOSP1-85 TaxID=2778367 RepID=UPI0019153187|nr:maturase [Ktedonobacter sp. SOSP1-85]GHO77258.1 maturase [Ktedonobacter sp. SOSP1-85]GHO80687.1 maturase [Ktedonobacter sp. SOSP1-85]GHO81154.1 maturase [Ktedonobacter sp. SOSP1-85]